MDNSKRIKNILSKLTKEEKEFIGTKLNMRICKGCGKYFQPKRKHKESCSPKCRMEYHEKKKRIIECPHCNFEFETSIKEVREL